MRLYPGSFSRKVPKGHLENSVGVVTSDRLSANKKLGEGIEHSYCWVHTRRDLLEIAAADPTIAGACLELLKLIGSIFHFNAARLLNEPGTAEASEAEKNLRVTVDTILKKCNEHLAAPSLHPELQRVVTGIVEDWAGLVLFVDLPAIPPDNNLAEQAIRGAKLGQNGYYGSFSEWSGHFAADMFTLIQTLLFNNEDPEQFLKGYLTACAENGGQAPPNAKDFLPWNRKSPYPKMAESNSSANVEAKRQLALSRKSNGRPQKKKKQNETGSRQSIPGNIPKSNEKQTVNKQTESKASANPTTSTQTRTDTTRKAHRQQPNQIQICRNPNDINTDPNRHDKRKAHRQQPSQI